MYCVGKIDRCCAFRQFNNASFRCKNINFFREEFGFYTFNKFKRVSRTLLQFHQTLQPTLCANLRWRTVIFAALFIRPMCCHAHFCHLIHFFRANLHFNRHTMWTDHRRMQRLIAIGFWHGNIIFNPPWARFIKAVHLSQYAIAGIHVLYNGAECINIHNGMKLLIF